MARFTGIIFLHLLFSASYAQTGKLIVLVKNIQLQKGGELSTGIFIKENFPKVGKQLIGNETLVSAPEMQIVFAHVPTGKYAVIAFQDTDKNKQLKTNFIGYPKEPIGFSRDARIKFGPPDFEDAKITVEANETLTITIILR